MTANEMFWQMPELPCPELAITNASLPVLDPPGILRSSSDSVVNGKGRPAKSFNGLDRQKSTSKQTERPREDVTIHTIAQGTLVVAARASSPSKAPSKSTTTSPASRAKQLHLQLPSFQALGIANPYPTSILTPPDEPTSLDWTSPDLDHTQLTPTASSSVRGNGHRTNTPQSPYPQSSILGASNENSTQAPAGSLISPSVPSEQRPGSNSSDSSTATEVASNMPWLDQALGVVLPLIPSGNDATGEVRILNQTQPLPLPQNVLGVPSALTGVINALQATFEQFSVTRYIDVTYAVPGKYSFGQLPSSPVTTPNRPAITASMDDYFSMPRTVVYAKGTFAATHAEACRSLAGNPTNRGFPQTVVAPSTITISTLERFIPPATKQEYEDLFKMDEPSALVDRMSELKPNSGCLIFIYPTKQGANTFKHDYVGPILGPVLSTMIGVRSVPEAVAEKINKLEAMDVMSRFDILKARINRSVRGMNEKGNGSVHRFALVMASKEKVHLGRGVWADWFLEQELPRFRQIVDDYYGRTPGRGLPQVHNQDFTAAGMVGEIIDGIKERPYDGGAPQEGIEVGVFVIKRTR
ncbi:MAG: hypothetical protein Q9178_001703 [Gyalolechia marmorata]